MLSSTNNPVTSAEWQIPRKTEDLPLRPSSPPTPPSPERDGPEMRVRDLSAWYGERKAIEGVSLTIVPRQVTAIIGPSGCGKSTLIRCLNRMHEVISGARAAGTVELNHQDIYGREVDPVRVRRVIGMVFQSRTRFR